MALLLFLLVVHAQKHPDYQSLYVNDFANIIGDRSKERLETMLRAAKKDRDVQVTVVTIERLSDYDSQPRLPTLRRVCSTIGALATPIETTVS